MLVAASNCLVPKGEMFASFTWLIYYHEAELFHPISVFLLRRLSTFHFVRLLYYTSVCITRETKLVLHT